MRLRKNNSFSCEEPRRATNSRNYFDVVVIGAGSGLLVARAAAERGLKVAIVEEGPFGGTCLNRGCIPSKMLIHVADVVDEIKNSERFGVIAQVKKIKWNAIQERVWKTIDYAARNIEQGNRTAKNVTVFKGSAVFEKSKVLRVGKERIEGRQVVISVGTRPVIPQISGIEHVSVHTSDTIMRLRNQPKKIVVIGGGYIGAELAHFFSSMGTEVTIVERGEPLLKNEDGEVAREFTRVFSKKCHVLLNTQVEQLEKEGNTILVHVKNVKKSILRTDAVLLATGRRPNSDVLNLEQVGIAINEKGFVKTNSYLETSVKGVWALGDIAGKYLFKHSANLEAECVVQNMFGRKTPVNYTAMPHAVFTSPQIAGVGMTEEEVQEKKIPYVVGKYGYEHTGMGKSMNAAGFVKFLVHKKSGKILCCHILGPDASTLIHEVVVAMRAGLSIDAVAQAVHVHPALSEVVQRAAIAAKEAIKK